VEEVNRSLGFQNASLWSPQKQATVAVNEWRWMMRVMHDGCDRETKIYQDIIAIKMNHHQPPYL
jgi:hypothetical protein